MQPLSALPALPQLPMVALEADSADAAIIGGDLMMPPPQQLQISKSKLPDFLHYRASGE